MKTVKLLFQGDSITDSGRMTEPRAGYPNHGLGPGYPALVTGKLLLTHPEVALEAVNRAVSGDTILNLYSRWRFDVMEEHPDILSILVGINDSWQEADRPHGADPIDFETVFRALLQWCRKENPNIRFRLLEPFYLPVKPEQERYLPMLKIRQAAARTLAKEFDGDFVELQSRFDRLLSLREPAYWSADGIHPSLAGHQLIADAWLENFKY